MEAYINNGAIDLADRLSFTVTPAASNVTGRRSVTCFPSGSNDYGGTGERVIKIGLNGDQWLDPRSVKIFYDITNTASLPIPANPDSPSQAFTNRLGPVSAGAWANLRRVRGIVGGLIIEEIDYYNRAHQMLDILTPAERRANTMVEGFGVHRETDGNYGIHPGRTKTVACKPMRGLFNQSKYLPVRCCPIRLELESSDAAEAVC